MHGPLQVEEVDRELLVLLRHVQHDACQAEIKNVIAKRSVRKDSSLIALTPFLNEDGLLCVDSRLDNAPL